MTTMPPPILRVGILGPPNAGKSTLFNRLMDKQENRTYKLHMEKKKNTKQKQRGRRRISGRLSPGISLSGHGGGSALVSDIAGTTRDRREAIGRLGEVRFLLMDTAGVDGLRLEHWYKGYYSKKHKKRSDNDNQKMKNTTNNTNIDPDDVENDYQRPMMEQAVLAAQQASVIFFVFDGRVGLTADDLETCRWLRRHVLLPDKNNNEDQHDDDSDDDTGNKQTLSSQHVVMVANKLEGTVLEDNPLYEEFLMEASRAGFGDAIPISALQGDGMSDLAVVLLEAQHEQQQRLGLSSNISVSEDDPDESKQQRPLQMAILGRPNVGKSTLVNALLQENRVITGSRPGLTRDAIRIPWTWQGHPIQIVDTAGIRKASQRQDPPAHNTSNAGAVARKKSAIGPNSASLLEDMAVQDALRALKVADVAVLVIDSGERSLTKQDLAIANAILQEGRALVVVANKMDLVVDEERRGQRIKGNEEEEEEEPYTSEDLARGVRQQLEFRFPYLRKTPIIPLDSRSSLLSDQGNMSKPKGRRPSLADTLMPVVMQARARWERTISTGLLNRWLSEVVDGHTPPPVAGRPTKLKYILQTKGRPPTFLVYTNQDTLPERYVRYLTRQFQDSFDMYGMQVRLAVKKTTDADGVNPYANSKSNKKRKGFGLGGRKARQQRGVERLKATGSRQLDRRKKRRKNSD